MDEEHVIEGGRGGGIQGDGCGYTHNCTVLIHLKATQSARENPRTLDDIQEHSSSVGRR